MSNLQNQLVIAEKEEVARGIRLLLGRPLITQSSDETAFGLIRRRQRPLQLWFEYTCGWTLFVEPRLGYARLMKVGVRDGATRPARRSRGERQPFDRRRYTLFCVVAAELLSTSVTTIGLLADRVAQACATDAALPAFDSSRQSERRAFVDAMRLLEELGALRVVDGNSDAYVSAADAKVLYHVDAARLIRLLASPQGASTLAVPFEMVQNRFEELISRLGSESRYRIDGNLESGSARNLWLRHSILRRLFDEPVLYREELTAEQADYLASLTGGRILRNAAEQAGFVLEEREEGYLLVDPEAIATDEVFPDGGSHPKVAALRLLDRLRASPLTGTGLTLAVLEILDEFPGWGMGYRSDEGLETLVERAVGYLVDFRLAHWSGDLLCALPAAARYVIDIRAAEGSPA